MRLGIFGGSFDPVHSGHLLLAQCCAEQARLDEVWLVPAAHQPLKPSGPRASDRHRLAMLQHACESHSKFKVSTLEIDRGGVSYSVDTLAAIDEQLPEATLFFLLGADALAELGKWHRPEEICRLAIPLVVHRAGEPAPNFEALREFVSAERYEEIVQHQIEMPPTPISSSEIRRRIAAGDDWQSLVPANVAEYIERHELYAG